MKQTNIRPLFVEFVPEKIEEGVLYISEKYRTAVHNCCCGCGDEVVTPLTPVDWKLRKDGDMVSLWPSIGNWNFQCKSHYVIRRNRVEWAAPMSKHQILLVQDRDRRDAERFFSERNRFPQSSNEAVVIAEEPNCIPERPAANLVSTWAQFKSWLMRLFS